MEKKNKFRLTLQQWLFCYAGSLGFGGLTWWATGNPWLAGGIVVGFTAVYVFYLAGKAAPSSRPVATDTLSRQQKRALNRKNKDN